MPFPDGVLVVDKTPGPTSHDVVAVARRALGVSRIGHTGTLDPMATGVLPLVIGRATRLAQFLTASDKDYEATVAFGRTTNTYDAMGTVVTTSGERPAREQIDHALGRFRGTFEQTPPAFSAKNIDGERSYNIARKAKDGVVVRPKAVTVTVRELDVMSFDGETAVLRMRVTAGFYVRALAHDLGATLGMGGVLTALRRTRSGEFGLAGAVPLAEVVQLSRETLAGRLLPFSTLLPELPAVTLRGPEHVARVKNGLEVAPGDLLAALSSLPELVRLMGPDGTLVGLARPAKTPGYLHCAVVFV
ncbi:MAG: tRNA pseudouridine(55) synthase TruB [Acidobacteria bacterium]|nr:tRNA pseudouridine(55) synthase TruB [Acidobacteriota bacterium]